MTPPMIGRPLVKTLGLLFFGSVFFLVVVLVGLFFWINLKKAPSTQPVSYGITFSDRYAEALGLDPKETFLALLDDLQVRKIRLPVYWDRIETTPGHYDFSVLDWQVETASARGADIILVVGQRVPRWPECFIPAWANESATKRQEALLSFEQVTVERYASYRQVKLWQVENEAFLDQRFGSCPPLDVAFLDRELTLVRQLDPTRPILMTDSGEISWWYDAASRGDQFGTTLYRELWHPRFGYLSYPLGPNFFLFKKWLIERFAHQDHLMVVELQAEPWARQWVAATPLDEQFRTMDEHKLVDNVNYARALGVNEIYLWGAEWWYWLKVKEGYPAVWETVRQYFSE